MDVPDDKKNVPDDKSDLGGAVGESLDDESNTEIDPDDVPMTMTIQEIENFVLSQMEEYMKDPKHNALLGLKLKVTELHDKIEKKKEEFNKIAKAFDQLYQDQVKFLRHQGLMEKPEGRSIGVGVDFPILPEKVAGLAITDDTPTFDNLPPEFSTLMPSTSSNKFGKKRIKNEPTDIKKSTEPIELIDLADEGDDEPVSTNSNAKKPAFTSTPAGNVFQTTDRQLLKHPAPLPPVPLYVGQAVSGIPPKPRLKISVDKNGIVLQWDMPPQAKFLKITGYEIYGYQEKLNVPVTSALWKKIGCVNPMPLPMSCTLTHFVEGFKYHFSIRAVAIENKFGHFSDPASIMFVPGRKN